MNSARISDLNNFNSSFLRVLINGSQQTMKDNAGCSDGSRRIISHNTSTELSITRHLSSATQKSEFSNKQQKITRKLCKHFSEYRINGFVMKPETCKGIW